MEKNTDFHGNQYSGDFSHGKDTIASGVSVRTFQTRDSEKGKNRRNDLYEK